MPPSLTNSLLSAAPRGWRRYRTWIVLAGISVGWKVVVLTLGAAVPRWVIGDGIAHLPLAQQAYALEAKAIAMPLWDHPIERFGIVRALCVMRVDSIPVVAPPLVGAGVWKAEPASCRGMGATVRAYTFFAIPYSEARLGCGTGVVEYRVFRRRQ